MRKRRRAADGKKDSAPCLGRHRTYMVTELNPASPFSWNATPTIGRQPKGIPPIGKILFRTIKDSKHPHRGIDDRRDRLGLGRAKDEAERMQRARISRSRTQRRSASRT